MRNKILNMLLIFGLIVAFLLFFTNIQTIIPTFALIFGLGNIYFTTKRSVNFIYFDLLWIFFTMLTLYNNFQFAMLILYIFYIFVAFYQYFNWKKHQNFETKETKTIAFDFDEDPLFVIYGLFITILIMIMFPNSENLILGSLISGLGITASIALAKRRYFSEVMFTFVNILQTYLMFAIGLYSLAVIPLLFLCNSIVFLIFNRKGE